MPNDRSSNRPYGNPSRPAPQQRPNSTPNPRPLPAGKPAPPRDSYFSKMENKWLRDPKPDR